MNDYLKKRQQQILDGRPLPEKKKYSIPKVSEKRKAKLIEQKEAGTAEDKLERWFEKIRLDYFTDGEMRGGVCMECGRFIPLEYSRHATAHLLPKKIFKSVATHPLNYLILGAGCGCHDKTHRVDKFIKMKIWPEAARRIKELIPLLPVDELRRISNQLEIALDNTPNN